MSETWEERDRRRIEQLRRSQARYRERRKALRHRTRPADTPEQRERLAALKESWA